MKHRLFIAAAIVSALLAIPITGALAKTIHQLKVEKTSNLQYQLRIENFKQKSLQEQRQTEQLQQQNADLQKQLQSKRETQARIAIAQSATAVLASVAVPGLCSPYRSLISQYPWPVDTAIAICDAESSGNPNVLSPSCDRGLMQVNCIHSAMVGGNLSALYDPTTNIRIAYQIYQNAHGWSPWTTFTSGRYRAYLQ